MRVGWARPSVRSDTELGADELAYVFNGNKVSQDLVFTLDSSVSVQFKQVLDWENEVLINAKIL